jgi:hypothetical protein
MASRCVSARVALARPLLEVSLAFQCANDLEPFASWCANVLWKVCGSSVVRHVACGRPQGKRYVTDTSVSILGRMTLRTFPLRHRRRSSRGRAMRRRRRLPAPQTMRRMWSATRLRWQVRWHPLNGILLSLTALTRRSLGLKSCSAIASPLQDFVRQLRMTLETSVRGGASGCFIVSNNWAC